MEESREKEVLVERFNQLIDLINSYMQDRKEHKKIDHHYQVKLFIEFVNIATDIYKSSLHENEKSLLWAKMKEIYPVIKDLRETMGGKQSPIEKYVFEEKVKGETKTIDEIKRPIERIKIKKEISLKIPIKKISSKKIIYFLLFSLAVAAFILAGNMIYKSLKNNPPVALHIPDFTWDEDTSKTINLNNYFSDEDDDFLYFNSTILVNIKAEISETGTITLIPEKDWNGTEKIVFFASDGNYITESNYVSLNIVNAPDCGKDGCEQGENCNNCQKDCGVCKEEIELRKEINETAFEEEKIQRLEEKEIAFETGDTARSLMLFGMTPGSAQGVTSPSKKIDGTSISAEQIRINPIPCVSVTEQYTEQIEFNQVNVSEALVPKGYELLMPPFDITCNKDDITITVNVPLNYVDVKAMKCSGKRCNPSVIKEVEKLKCSNEIVEYYLRKEDYLLPEYMPFEIIEKQADISSDNNKIESSNNKISFYGNFDSFAASIGMPEEPVPEPINPSLMLVGTPLILKFDKEISVSTEIIMPYVEDKRIDENTIAVYVNVDNTLWEYIGGEIDKGQGTVKVNIKDISKYLNSKNEAEFALMGLLCISCLESEFMKVYEPETKTRDAVLLVHGLISSPATFQDIINDIRLTKQPWNVYAYGYPSTRKIRENAIDLADHLQAHSDEYDNIYIVAHSLGGLIAQQALYYSEEENEKSKRYNYLSKVRKVVLIGVPNKGSPAAELYKNLFDYLINIKTIYNLFDLNSDLLSEVVAGLITPKIEGIDYYVIAGIKPYSFNLLFFKLTSKEAFKEYELNDGIVSTTSAQYIGDKYINDKCYNYWEVNVTHTELIDDPSARSLIERIVAKKILNGINNTAILGHNKYFDIKIDDCSPDDRYLVIGKRIDNEETRDLLGCKCGNGYCGEGEDKTSCPSDCAVIKDEKIYNVGKYILYFVFLVLAVLSYRQHRKRKALKKPKKKEKKKEEIKEEHVPGPKQAAKPEEKDEAKKIVAKPSLCSTDFDRMHNLVEEKKDIEINDVAKLLGLKKADAMEWAKILEEHNLITIKYLLFGGARLKKHVKKKKKKKQVFFRF